MLLNRYDSTPGRQQASTQHRRAECCSAKGRSSKSATTKQSTTRSGRLVHGAKQRALCLLLLLRLAKKGPLCGLRLLSS